MRRGPPKLVALRRYPRPWPGCSPPLPPGVSSASVARPTVEPREKGQPLSLTAQNRSGTCGPGVTHPLVLHWR